MQVDRCYQILSRVIEKPDFKSWDQVCEQPLKEVLVLFEELIPMWSTLGATPWSVQLRKAHIVLYKKNDIEFSPLLKNIHSCIRFLNPRVATYDHCRSILSSLEECPELHIAQEDAIESYAEVQESFSKLSVYVVPNSLEIGIRLRKLHRRIALLKEPRFNELRVVLRAIIQNQNLMHCPFERVQLIIDSMEECDADPNWQEIEKDSILDNLEVELLKGSYDYSAVKTVLQEGLAKFDRCKCKESNFKSTLIDARRKVAEGLRLLEECKNYFFPEELAFSGKRVKRNGYTNAEIKAMLTNLHPVLVKTPLDFVNLNIKLREFRGRLQKSDPIDGPLCGVVRRTIDILNQRLNPVERFALVLISLESSPECHLLQTGCLEDITEIRGLFKKLFMIPYSVPSDANIYNMEFRKIYRKLVRHDARKFMYLITMLKEFIDHLNKYANSLSRCEWIYNALQSSSPAHAWNKIMPETVAEAAQIFNRLSLLLPGIEIDRNIWMTRLIQMKNDLLPRGDEVKQLLTSVASCSAIFDRNVFVVEQCHIILNAASHWPENQTWTQATRMSIPEVTELFQELLPATIYVQTDREQWIARLKRLKWNLKVHETKETDQLLSVIKQCIEAFKFIKIES